MPVICLYWGHPWKWKCQFWPLSFINLANAIFKRKEYFVVAPYLFGKLLWVFTELLLFLRELLVFEWELLEKGRTDVFLLAAVFLHGLLLLHHELLLLLQTPQLQHKKQLTKTLIVIAKTSSARLSLMIDTHHLLTSSDKLDTLYHYQTV